MDEESATRDKKQRTNKEKPSWNSESVSNWGITTLIWILCAAPVVLLVLLCIIIGKIWLVPIGNGTIDSLSLAGLAGSILGVGSALLTILVGLAAVAWLVKLDQRIDQRTKKQVAKRMEQLRQEQERILTERFQKLLDTKKSELDTAHLKLRQEFVDLNNQIDLLLDIAMRPDVEDMQKYLSDKWETNKSKLVQSMATQIIHRYELIIDKYNATDSQETEDPQMLLARIRQWRDRLDALAQWIKDRDNYTREEKDTVKSNLVIAEVKLRRCTKIIEEWRTQYPDRVAKSKKEE